MSRIVVDSREHALMEHLPGVETKNLDLGDVWITHGDKKCVVERKRVGDLLDSLHDGRYQEQCVRLQAMAQSMKVIVIEGAISDRHEGTITTAMASLVVHKGFHVMRTDDVKHTAQLILALARKMETATAAARHSSSYANAIKPVKKQNITRDNIDQIILSTIPGISKLISRILLNKFRTVFDLQSSLRSDPTCLDSLRMANGDRLASNVKAKLFELLG